MHVSQSRSAPRQKKIRFSRWLPILGAATLMLMVAIVSARTLSELKNATSWRKHSVQVILTVQSFQNNLLELQRSMRSYVTTGDTNSEILFENDANLEPKLMANLFELTRDNPQQRRRLQQLAGAVQAIFSYDIQMFGLYKERGAAAVLNADLMGVKSRTLFADANDVLKKFSSEEDALLNVRDDAEQSDYRHAEKLLVIGSILAAALLLIANWIASHELASRHRAETKLHRTLMLQKAILNSADYAIVTTDPNGLVQTFNPAAEKLLGYSADEIIGKTTPMRWRDSQEIAERAAQLSKKLGRIVRPTFEAIAAKVQFDEIDDGEWTFIRKNGSRFVGSLVVTALTNHTGNFTGFIGIFRDISARKNMEAEREKLIIELRDALAQVKALSGLIPICGWCKNVRNDSGYWQSVEQYVHSRSEATFTHGICPDCQEKFKADIARANGGKRVA
jgi:PAS domain S-box-containing protein